MSKRLSKPQENIWNMKKVYSDTSITNIGGVYKLSGLEFNLEAWTKAINLFIANSSSMRTRIVDAEIPLQNVIDFIPESFEFVDLSSLSETEKGQLYKKWVKEKLEDKLYKFRIVKFSENESGVFFIKDHIISDAYSEGIMLSDITNYYISFLRGLELSGKERPSYDLLLEREDEYFQSDKYQKDKEYWSLEFSEEPSLSLFKENRTADLTADKYKEILDADFTKQIKEFCSETAITPAVFFESLLFAYLKIISDENKITIGMPILNRVNKTERNIPGMFINTLPFSLEVNDDLDFESLCKRLSSKKFNTLRHQQFPFSDIQNDLKDRFNYVGRLFDIVFSFQNASIIKNEENIVGTSEWIPSGYVDNALIIHVDDRDGLGKYTMNLEYQKAVLSLDEVKRILDRLKVIAQQVLKNKNMPISDINVLCEKDIEDYNNFNNSNKVQVTKNVVELFEEQVRINPNETALIFGDDCNLSFNDLNSLANSLAHTISDYNLPKGSVIPIVGERSYYTIIALLAIAKAGYAYCLLDNDINVYPKERIDSLIETCAAEMFITHGNCDYTKEGVKVLNLSDQNIWSKNCDNLNNNIDLNDIFVILHTSGSSGIPKATKISHEAAVNMGSNNAYLIDGCDYGISLITMTFDAFTMDILTPLLNGKTLVLSTPDEQKSMSLTHQLVAKYPKSFTILTPTKAKYYLASCDDNSWQNVDSIVLGGETFGEDLIDLIKQKAGARLYNLYGPTETTVFNSGKEIIDNKVSLGKPTTNFQIFILNKNNQILPPMIMGEIVAVGVGVASGYLGEEEATKKHFIIFNNQRAYKSGDQGLINEDIELTFCGRKDSQYKINGVRFEASEIEKLLNLYEGIKLSAVALKKHNGISYVVAYYETDEYVDEEKLIEYLEQKLPISVVPSIFYKMTELPTTRTGKLVSRDKLPEPDFNRLNDMNYVAPENETQEILIAIWTKILKKEKIGVNSTWKSLGGGSLDLLSMLNLIEKRFNVKIKPSDLPKSPTILFLDKIINGLVINDNIVENYDLDKIIFNKEPKINDDILLTGVTGYLGSHLLYNLLTETNKNVYCLVRDFNKFNELMKFYFKDELDNYQSRIHLIKGDIAEDNLGLSLEDYTTVKNNVASAINAAANVKHYGPMDEFVGVNVKGVYNLGKFCAEANAKLHHISTISVSGQGMTTQTRENILFSESDLDVGQKYQENIYIWTKYVGEKIVRDFMEKGLSANVYRFGFITNRYSDNLFQYNADNSGFNLLVEAISEIGVLPQELEAMDVQSVTVDDGATAITTLMENVADSRTYHIYDPAVKNLSEYLIAHNIKYEIVDAPEFMNRLEILIKENNKYSLIQQYFKAMSNSATNNITINNETTEILNGLGFYYQVPDGGSKSENNSLLCKHPPRSES